MIPRVFLVNKEKLPSADRHSHPFSFIIIMAPSSSNSSEPSRRLLEEVHASSAGIQFPTQTMFLNHFNIFFHPCLLLALQHLCVWKLDWVSLSFQPCVVFITLSCTLWNDQSSPSLDGCTDEGGWPQEACDTNSCTVTTCSSKTPLSCCYFLFYFENLIGFHILN